MLFRKIKLQSVIVWTANKKKYLTIALVLAMSLLVVNSFCGLIYTEWSYFDFNTCKICTKTKICFFTIRTQYSETIFSKYKTNTPLKSDLNVLFLRIKTHPWPRLPDWLVGAIECDYTSGKIKAQMFMLEKIWIDNGTTLAERRKTIDFVLKTWSKKQYNVIDQYIENGLNEVTIKMQKFNGTR